MTDLVSLNQCYQFSLNWYFWIFQTVLWMVNKDNKDENSREDFILKEFKFKLFHSVCQTLREKEKPIFGFLMATTLLLKEGVLTRKMLRYFILGGGVH